MQVQVPNTPPLVPGTHSVWVRETISGVAYATGVVVKGCAIGVVGGYIVADMTAPEEASINISGDYYLAWCVAGAFTSLLNKLDWSF